ncbi:MAG TPA: 30S ribosome-binding factor RbfA [Bacilli bacterium]|jgi:ribosome-binding factor A|nr:30S ribosome-binding factor RbfA [Bacilli bacterium]HQC84100.1 30S ribosome-binding factor RbfA [Bacilli bacterium]
MNKVKQGRISSEISQELSSIMILEARDETLKHVTITGCEVTNDLSFARIYYTYYGNESAEAVKENLKVAEPYLKTMLASHIRDLRKMPELRFIVDESREYGEKIDKIIEEIHKDDE